MKLLNAKSLSSVLSVVFHAALLILIFFFVNKSVKNSSTKLIEVGFAGYVESNSPGSPGSGADEVQSPPKPPEQIKNKPVEKAKPKLEKINDLSLNKKPSKKTEQKKSSSDSTGTATADAGTSSTGASGSGAPGSGGTGNGQSGSGLPKKGTPVDQGIYFVAVDQMPVPYGGMASINAKVFRPQLAKENNIRGTVYVQAYIDEFGKVRKVMLIKGLGFGCDQIALRAVQGTTFQPGLLHGVPVKVQMTIPVSFGSRQ